MSAKATLRFSRIPATKARYVVDQIRGQHVESALQLLKFSNRRAAKPILKLLNSAIANAEQSGGLDLDILYVKKAMVNEGPMLKRVSPRAQGRAYVIRHRTSHITLELDEK